MSRQPGRRLFRVIAALSLVGVVSAGGVVAQTDPGTPTAISGICGFEFATAERAVQEALLESGVEAGSSAGPDASATPVAAPLGASLDAAIRGCATVQEWLAAAQMYPDALRGADPLTTLFGRCTDPESGLGQYATCGSLVAALATPQPTPSAMPEPLASPEPVASPSPPPRNDMGASTNAPRTTAERPGRKARVTVSKRHVATIPYATEIRYFDIQGDSPQQLLKRNQKRGRRHCRDHRAIACVLMGWDVRASERYDARTSRCTVDAATTTLSATVYLPRWTKRKRAAPDLVAWWRKVLMQSAVHEAQHIKIQRKHLADFRRDVAGRPCRSVTRLLERHMAKAREAQAAFDEIQYERRLPRPPARFLR